MTDEARAIRRCSLPAAVPRRLSDVDVKLKLSTIHLRYKMAQAVGLSRSRCQQRNARKIGSGCATSGVQKSSTFAALLTVYSSQLWDALYRSLQI